MSSNYLYSLDLFNMHVQTNEIIIAYIHSVFSLLGK